MFFDLPILPVYASRTADEAFTSLAALTAPCRAQQENSEDRWHRPQELLPTSDMTLCAGVDGVELALNDWSFSQLCWLCGVSKDTLNRLSSKTASRTLHETLPQSEKRLQILTTDNAVCSIHGVSYTRLCNAELVAMLQEFGVDFRPTQEAVGGGSGLYCGEQDMFCFLIDPIGWAEIDGETFAPGFFVWNSDVGRGSLASQTFCFQKICQNHIVWDAVEVVEFTGKHTANVHDGQILSKN